MRPSSPRRSATSRANGKLYRGSVISVGKRRSFLNDLNGPDVLLRDESPAAFDCQLQRYAAEFLPRNSGELDLVNDLAVIRWQQRRLWTLEQDLVRDYTTNTGETEDEFKSSFLSLLNNPKLRNLYRHQDHLQVRYKRTLHRLTGLRLIASVPKAA